MIDARQHVIGKLYGFAMEEITLTSSALGLTFAKLDVTPRPKEVFIQCETADCRYFYDGSIPTTDSGLILHDCDLLRIKGYTSMRNFLAINKTATAAKLTVIYER